MRLLIWHVDSFRAEPTEWGRSKVADSDPRAVAVEDALVVFVAAEKQDEPTPEAVAERATAAIEEVLRQMGAHRGAALVRPPVCGTLHARNRLRDPQHDRAAAIGQWLHGEPERIRLVQPGRFLSCGTIADERA